MGDKVLLMGNEAIARGAVEAGVRIAAAYPGTPSSEILSELAKFSDARNIHVEWSINEKVALEVAAGGAYAGLRTLAAMKQVGLNVAADPVMSLAYIGVKGGMVIVVADDPGPHSSQTEQDTRLFARFAKLPVFDPATPQEAREMTVAAFDLSEQLGLPVILRPTTRVAHVCQDVEIDDVVMPERTGKFEKSPGWIIFPSLSFLRHQWLEGQQLKMSELFNLSPFNHSQGEGRTGVICSGVAYNYVMESVELLGLDWAVLKIGTPYPLPAKLVSDFLRERDKVVVIEELDPVVEDQVIAVAWKEKIPVAVYGKHDATVPIAGEFNVDIVANILKSVAGLSTVDSSTGETHPVELPQRTPILCAGCPHRASFYAIKQAAKGMDAVFTGDIGCYTLGMMPPLKMVDTCLCMGASISLASGLYHADPHRPHIACLGDSTFFHSGVSGLINAVYNKARLLLVILDNQTTAMTGFQPHPGIGRDAAGRPAPQVDLKTLVTGCGVAWVKEVDPYDIEEAEKAVREALQSLQSEGPAVIIMRRICSGLAKPERRFAVDHTSCAGCGLCLTELGCPALTRIEEKPVITASCTGCGVCARVCPAAAIVEVS